MNERKCTIEIYLNGRWIQAADLTVEEKNINKGFKAPARLDYQVKFVGDYLDNAEAKLSCLVPVTFEFMNSDRWPAFVLDILPSGAGRRAILSLWGKASEGALDDWRLLCDGAANPPGNIRVAQAAAKLEPEHGRRFKGFERQDIVTRDNNFIEYARESMAAVAGSSGAQGDAPKFLLTQDKEKKYYADGRLPDDLAVCHWLVKYPRGNQDVDAMILRNEAAYMRVAKAMGITVHADLIWKNNTLFIPRFDRKVTEQGVERYGLETLCSLANVADFGVAIPQMDLIKALMKCSDEPVADAKEFVYRDILNIAMGNTDNHARNTSVIKIKTQVRLSPLYDFAPMFLDPQGIARTSRWPEGIEKGISTNWDSLARLIFNEQDFPKEAEQFTEELKHFMLRVKELPLLMKKHDVDVEIVKRVSTTLSQLG